MSISNGHSPALVNVPVRGRSFGRARWSAVNVAGSAVCPCSAVTGNTVWRNHILGLYVPDSSPVPHSYLAAVRGGRRASLAAPGNRGGQALRCRGLGASP